MTDSEKLDVILEKLMQLDVRAAASDRRLTDIDIRAEAFDKRLADIDVRTAAFDKRLAEIDVRIAAVDKGVADLDATVTTFDKRLTDLKRQQMRDTAELKAMDSMIFDEIERVHEILIRRTDALEKKIG